MSTTEQPDGQTPSTRTYYDDEISLTDLILVLWRHRLAIIIVGAVVVAAALAYALLATPVYKATAYYRSPLEQDIEELNKAQRFGLTGYSTGQVFNEYLQNLRSLELRRAFFADRDLLSYYAEGLEEVEPARVFDKSFNEKLAVKEPGKGDAGFHSISFELDDAQQSAQWLNDFAAKAAEKTIAQLVSNVKADIDSGVVELETKIASRRALAEQRREDRIVQLKEALEVASALGIQKPSDYNIDIARQQGEAVSVNTANLPLYARGTTALKAEIDALQGRENDDPFIGGLRDFQEQLASLRAITIDPANVKVARVDRAAIVPYEPEKPRRVLIMAIAILLGGFLGVMAAFVLEFWKNFRGQLSEESE